jgi:hypothetical protein
MGDIISKKEILSQLHGDTIPVYIFDEIDSTNRFAKTLNDDFALVISDTQSMGRGRLGRSFHSPKGVGIYMLGLPEMPVKNVTMENLNFEITGNEAGVSAVSALDRERSKGEGISLENVENVVMNDVQISCSREMYVLNHVKNVMINGVEYE